VTGSATGPEPGREPGPEPGSGPVWRLRLYVNGASPRSAAAIDNIRAICDRELAGRVDLVIVDVRSNPALVLADQVYAAPTLVKELPEPLRHLVGDLSDLVRLREGLDLEPAPTRDE
jgi:circadian clock protein KaiB